MELLNRSIAIVFALFLGMAGAGCQTDSGMGGEETTGGASGGSSGSSSGSSGSSSQGGYSR